MKARHPRIPSLEEVIGEASPADFQLFTSALSERTLSPEDLGAELVTSRPDLVAIMIRSGGGLVSRLTRRKVLSGKVRKSRPKR